MTVESLKKYFHRGSVSGQATRNQVCGGERGAGPQCRHSPRWYRQADQALATVCFCSSYSEDRTEVRREATSHISCWSCSEQRNREKRLILKVEFLYVSSYSYIIKENKNQIKNKMSGKESLPRTSNIIFQFTFLQIYNYINNLY